jgi:hypothetical protein
MSNSGRHEWCDQHAALAERMKAFLEDPGGDQLEAVLASMRAYADAANNGSMEIPIRWTSTN